MTNIKLLDGDLPVKLEWLRSFLTVAELGGFTRAARALHLSQPAVSTHVKELEANLGTRLFESAGGRVRLSAAGEAGAREARAVLDGVHSFRDAVVDADARVRGTLSLGASTTPANYLLPPLMGRYERRHPGARTRLGVGNSTEILGRLAANEIELAFVGAAPEGPEFVVRPFARDEIVLFAAADHPLARKRSLKPSDLRGERILRREADSATRALGDAWFAARRLELPTMDLDGPETVKRAAAAGLGLGLLSRFAVDWEVRDRRLAVLSLPGLPIRRPLYVAWLAKKRITPSMKAFLELLGQGIARVAGAQSRAAQPPAS